MKKPQKLTALLLCFALVFGLFGCTVPAEQTQPATETAADTSAAALYQNARAAVDAAADITLQITAVKTTTVGGEVFREETSQTLSYAGLGTDAPRIHSLESVDYGDAYAVDYEEVYDGGTLYVTLDDSYYFSGTVTAEECAQRYLPAVLLDAALYGSVDMTVSDSGTTVRFSEPTAPESWAVPDGAELLDASGTALIRADGTLEKTTCSVTYRYGSTEISLEAEVSPIPEQADIAVPENSGDFVQLEYVDAPRLSEQAAGYLLQAQTATVSSTESVMTYAGGAVRNQSTVTDYDIAGDGLMAKVDIGIYLMDYTTSQSQEYDQVELYQNGEYTVCVDDGEPEAYDGVTDALIAGYCQDQMLSHLVSLEFWEDAAITDLGSTYLIECTLNDAFGDTMCASVCTTFWNDDDFLDAYASAYAVNETSCYLSIDKYTGLPTAAGFYYEGQHTIDGYDYLLTAQSDQSIEAPAFAAYYNITEEMRPEAEPETKATPLFYHVTGENGQEMWLLGTIHVGDARTAYLPQEIYDAFAAADALALEYNSVAFDEQMEEDDELQDAVSEAYFYSDGTAADHISDNELYETAVRYIKASGNYNMNTPYMKLSIWSNTIENFYLRQGYALTSEQGVESRLEKLAEEQGKEIRDVESGLFQVRMLTGWSDALQELLLEESLETSAPEYWDSVNELYEKWCAGDEAALREALSDEVDTSELTEEELAEYEAELPLYGEYNKAMSTDRNDGMLQVAIEYLESGDTVFFAVGLAHLLNDTNGLVDTLREAGYTVELVQYAESIE